MDLLKIHSCHRMYRAVYTLCVLILLGTLSLMTACADKSGQHTPRTPLAPLRVLSAENGRLDGHATDIYPMQGMYAGYFLPDGKGGLIWIGSEDIIPMPNASLEDAREFTLQLHELGDQLLGNLSSLTLDDMAIEDVMVTTPMPFVSLKDTPQNSSLGRYLGEQMVCECTRHGLTTRGCPINTTPTPSRESTETTPAEQNAVEPSTDYTTHIITGTYYNDANTLVLNARLIDRSTGNIISTGLQVINKTPFLQTLLAERSLQINQVDVPIREFTLQ